MNPLNRPAGCFTKSIPPRIEEVRIYFNQKGISHREAEAFFLFYEKKQWTSKKGFFLRSWKNIAYSWIVPILRAQPVLFEKTIH